MVKAILSMGPMPQDPENIGDHLYMATTITNVQTGELFNTFQYYWPSSSLPPYPMPKRWIWAWYDDKDDNERIWIIVTLD